MLCLFRRPAPALIAVLSAASAGAASTAFGGSAAAALSELTVVEMAAGAVVFVRAVAAGADDSAGGATTFDAGVVAGWDCDIACDGACAELSGLSPDGTAAMEAGDDAGFAGAGTIADAAV